MKVVGRIKETLSYFRRSAGRDLRPGPTEHKARVPPTGAQQRYDSSKQHVLSVLKVDEMNKLHVRIQSRTSHPQTPL
jgi:hypothetical protein